jgi:DNA-directed RNA polymerase specialized sigma24 family protein
MSDIYSSNTPHRLTIKDWTDFNYKLLGDAINRITSNDSLSEELLHYTLTAFLERPDAQQIVDSGGGFYFCLRIATNSWKSTTSPFYRIYRDPNPRQPLTDMHAEQGEEQDLFEGDQPENLDLYKKIDTLLADLNWYETELTKAYAEHNCNASLLAKVTNIPRTSINLTLNRVRAHIKTKLSHE